MEFSPINQSTNPLIILASSSPRRKELLTHLAIPFRIVTPEIEEHPGPGESPDGFAVRAAEDKARWTASHMTDGASRIIIAGDTVVVLDNRILGKPRDEAEAGVMLRSLSGKTHKVITGLCVLAAAGADISMQKSLSVSTDVAFKELTDREIDEYVATGEPMDKAGAYAVQGKGGSMVSAIRGSYTNVVGPGTPLKSMYPLVISMSVRQMPATTTLITAPPARHSGSGYSRSSLSSPS